MSTATADTFRALFTTLSAAIEAEDTILAIGREFLPECARAVLDDRDAVSPAYYAWLCEQVARMDGEAEQTKAEDARLLAEVERAYATAAGTWTGRSWDDGDKITPESTDDQIAAMLTRGEDIAITCWGIDESDEAYRRRARAALETLNLLWQREDCDDEFSAACDALRSLAQESDDGVAFQAHVAEQSAAEAVKNARLGNKQTALSHADHAAAAERMFGDAPTWGPFAEAVRAWSEHEAE